MSRRTARPAKMNSRIRSGWRNTAPIDRSAPGFVDRDDRRDADCRLARIGRLARALKRQLVGGGFEFHPADPGEVNFHPGMGIRLHNHEPYGIVIVVPLENPVTRRAGMPTARTITAMVVAK